MIGSVLRRISPKAFDAGMEECNTLAKSLIARSGVRRLLDLGCMDGALTREFAELIEPQEIIGIEMVDEYIGDAVGRGIECVKTDLNKPWGIGSDTMDVIFSSQNIEHLHNTRLYLEECYRCLRPGGQLIVLTENLASLVNIGALVFGWQPFSCTGISDWSVGNPLTWHKARTNSSREPDRYYRRGISRAGHVRVLAFEGLRGLLNRVGFESVKVMTAGYLPFWGRLSRMLCRLDGRHGHFLVSTAFKPEPGGGAGRREPPFPACPRTNRCTHEPIERDSARGHLQQAPQEARSGHAGRRAPHPKRALLRALSPEDGK